MKATLLNTASQELRIPLTVIKGCTATLLQYERRLPYAEQQEFLWAIHSATDQLEVTLERLVQLATLEVEPLALGRAPVNLVRIVRKCISTVEQRHDRLEPHQMSYRVRHAGVSGRQIRPRYLVWADSYWLPKAIGFLLEQATQQKVEDEVVDILFRPLPDDLDSSTSASQYASCALDAPQTLPNGTPVTPHRVLTTIRIVRPAAPSKRPDATGDPFAQMEAPHAHDVVTDMGLGYALCERIVQLHGGGLCAGGGDGNGWKTGARSPVHILLPTEG